MDRPFPAYRGDPSYLFVCYSHEDSAVVFPELERLRDWGADVYYDEGIAPGHEWTQELADAIDGAAHLLFFVTPASVHSRHCRNEVQYALDRTKPVISIFLEPTELHGGLRFTLGSSQAIMKHDRTTPTDRRCPHDEPPCLNPPSSDQPNRTTAPRQRSFPSTRP